MEEPIKEKYTFYVSFKDGKCTSQEVSLKKGTELLKEIMIKKSKIRYAAIIKEEIQK